MIPALKVRVPTWLIPAAGEAAVVAPVIDQVSKVTPQLSAVVASGTIILEEQTPAPAIWDMFAGQAIVGSSESFTVTVKVHDEVFSAASLTVYVTVVVPLGKMLPGV